MAGLRVTEYRGMGRSQLAWMDPSGARRFCASSRERWREVCSKRPCRTVESVAQGPPGAAAIWSSSSSCGRGAGSLPHELPGFG